MNADESQYLATAFADLLNYNSDDVLAPIDPIRYRTPEGDTCLHVACLRGDLRAATLLLDAGLDVNGRGDMGNTPLHYARKSGHESVVRLLIARGADVTLLNEFRQRAGP